MTSIDPIVLFFLLGFVARLVRSDLRLPPAIYDFLSVVLLIAIGLKGGVELARQSLGALLPGILIVVMLGIILTLLAFPILRFAGRLKRVDAASVAAHYGSVSVGTFAVGMAYLAAAGVSYEAYMTLYLVLLEIPAIIVGVMLARGVSKRTRWGKLAREVLFGKSIVLLIGGLLIGWAVGPAGVEPIGGLFFDLFKGVLALFLLEMGLICGNQVATLKRYGLFLILFGVIMPLIGASLGTVIGSMMSLSVGGTTLLAVLAGSASYIAVPAAMRITVPESNPALSLSASLGVTFPFNVTVGIPLYLTMARWIHS